MKRRISIFVYIFTVLVLISCSSSVEMIDKGRIKTSLSGSNDGKIEAFYEKYSHAKHRMGATGPDYFDCSGFTQKAFKELYRISLPRTSQSQYFAGSRVSRINDLEYGDLVFFNISGRGVSHVGIYLDDYRFAHASSSLGVTISNITMDYWKKRFIEGRRVLE